MNKRELNLLLEVYGDCLSLKRKKYLTEYGEGQLDLSIILLGKKKLSKLIKQSRKNNNNHKPTVVEITEIGNRYLNILVLI